MSGSVPHAIFSHASMSQSSSGLPTFDKRHDDETDKTALNALNAPASSDFIIHLSDEGQALSQQSRDDQTGNITTNQNDQTDPDQKDLDATTSSLLASQNLTPEEQKQLEDMKRRDQAVRIHELAHASAGGVHTGAPSYTYTQGPDGRRYITDGEVSINTDTKSDDPKQTIADMEQVYRAALAPAEPSAADRKAASQAQAIIREARLELAKQQRAETQNPQSQQSLGTSDIADTLESTLQSRRSSDTYTTERHGESKAATNEYPSSRGDFLNKVV